MYLSGFFLKTPFYHSLKVSKQKLVKSAFLKVYRLGVRFYKKGFRGGRSKFQKIEV